MRALAHGLRARNIAALVCSAGNYFQTAAGAGEGGIASGFGCVTLFLKRAPISATSYMRARLSSGGWGHFISTVNQLGTTGHNGSAYVDPPRYQATIADDGAISCLVSTCLGGGFQRFWMNRAFIGEAAQSGFLQSAVAASIGALAGGGSPAVNAHVIAGLDFRGIPSDAQILELFDIIRRLGDIPSVVPGASAAHRWSAARLAAVDGATAPASLPDTVTTAPGDAMQRQGAPSLSVFSARRTQGRTTYGVMGASGTTGAASNSIYRANYSLDDAAAYWWTWFGILHPYAPGAGARYLISNGSSNPGGWALYLDSGNGGWVVLSHANGASASGNPTNVTVPFLGLPFSLTGFWDGATISIYARGAFFASGPATTHVLSPGGALNLHGLHQNIASNCDEGATCFGVCGGAGLANVPTPAEFAAQWKAMLTTSRLAAIPGKTTCFHDIHQDIVENGGPKNGAPFRLKDRIGTGRYLQRIGSDQRAIARVERLYNYETRPVFTGLRGFTMADGYASAAALDKPGTRWASLMFMLDLNAQTLASRARRVLLSRRDASGQGWSLYTVGAHGSLAGEFTTSSGTYTTPLVSLGVFELGKLLIATIHYDQTLGQLRFFVRRNQFGATVSAPGAYNAPASTPLYLGRDHAGTDTHADGVTFYGLALGSTSLLLGDLHAQHDDSMADDELSTIQGKTEHLYSFVRDVREASGAVPAMLRDRIGTDHLYRVGSPSLSSIYTRPWRW